MPRPDLASLGVGYRRIPLLAIGKDIYCDSRLIISKLESRYPGSNLTPPTAADSGISKLFENWTIDGGIFANTVKLMPFWHDDGFLKNKAFLDDRQRLMGGRRMTAETMKAARVGGLQHLRQAFDLLEGTFLADGREWILATKEPSVADIDAVWPFKWLTVDKGMRGSLPEDQFGEKNYPRVYAWVGRFMEEVLRRKREGVVATALDGRTVSDRMVDAKSPVDAVPFQGKFAMGLNEGERVEVYPSDYGQMGKSSGILVGFTSDEVVLLNEQGLHLHFPLWNFTVRKAPEGAKADLKGKSKI